MNFLDRLTYYPISPTYDKEIKKLENLLFDADKPLKVKIKHFDGFTSKFTTLLHTFGVYHNYLNEKRWEYVHRWDGLFYPDKTHIEITNRTMERYTENFPLDSDYFIPRQYNDLIQNKLKMRFHRVFLKEVEDHTFKAESFSDVPLESYEIWYEMNIDNCKSFKSVSEIRKCLESYMEISEALDNGNIDEWIRILEKTEGVAYIVKNIEQSIGDQYFWQWETNHKKTWELLLQYSEKCSMEKLLESYRRYCRYYVDDLDMRKKYRLEIENAKQTELDTTKWELDSIKLEWDFGVKKRAEKWLQNYVKTKKIDSKVISRGFGTSFKKVQKLLIKHPEEITAPPKVYFTKNGIIQQNFSFPSPTMKYILENANYETTQKLQYSSKQLYISTNKTLCFKFSVSEVSQTEAVKEALFVSAGNPKIDHINNFCIENTLYVSQGDNDFHEYDDSQEYDDKILRKFLPKIQSCAIQFLILRLQKLNLKEYNFLTSAKRIKKIAFVHSIVVNDSNDEIICLEILMASLPNAIYLSFEPSPLITVETFQILERMERGVKIDNFVIQPITVNIPPLDLYLFIRNHFAPTAGITLYRETTIDHVYLDSMEAIYSWDPSSELKYAVQISPTDDRMTTYTDIFVREFFNLFRNFFVS